jgi:hypothetical protein
MNKYGFGRNVKGTLLSDIIPDITEIAEVPSQANP